MSQSTTLHPLELRLAAAWPPAKWADVTVLLAVSGGCDSVALLRAMVAIRAAGAGRLCVVHLNHQLRADSDVDELFVTDLCRQLTVPCEVDRIRLEEQPDGIEAAARSARYRFLADAAGQLGARYVVTAHTADDQAETILHRILRGTGIGGLAGMARARPLGHATLLRPFLAIERAELAAYLRDLGQPFREDASNADPRFTRNRLRHELLPWLAEQFNPSVKEALLRLGTLAGEAQAVVDALVDQLWEMAVRSEGAGAIVFDLTKLAPQPPYLVRELLMAAWRRQGWPMQAMGHAQWQQLCQMAISAAAGETIPPQVFPGNIAAHATGEQLRLQATTVKTQNGS
jgi:tRNA(Ile)-lysidine synthase